LVGPLLRRKAKSAAFSLQTRRNLRSDSFSPASTSHARFSEHAQASVRLSFTHHFSGVQNGPKNPNRFNGFSFAAHLTQSVKTVETVHIFSGRKVHPAKAGC
jgi:hypothetical protein